MFVATAVAGTVASLASSGRMSHSVAAATSGVTLVVAASDTSDKSSAGFVCDGVDDQKEINAALASLPDGANSSGTVVLLEGTYTLSDSIVIDKDGARLVGQGWGTVLRLANGANSTMVLVGPDANRQFVEIAELRLFGNGENQTAGHGILLRGSGHRLHRINIEGARQDGIRAESADGSDQYEFVCDDLTVIHSGRDGISLDDAIFNAEIIRVVVHGARNGPGRYGIYDRGGQNKFLLCHTYHNPSHGFFKDYGREARISGGEYESNGGYGIRLFSVVGCSVDGALFYGNGDAGISLSYGVDCTLTGNTSRSTNETGIYLSGSSRNLVSGNTIYETTKSGIHVGDGSRLNRIAGNVVHDVTAGTSSIWVSDSSDNDVTANLVDIDINETGKSNGNRFIDNRVSAGRVNTIGKNSEKRGNLTV
jgi:parallel beta-helix repeat protein